MNAASSSTDPFEDHPRRSRRRLPYWLGPAVIVGLFAVGALILVLQGPTVGERENATRIINVVLPPPPPPPPPPPERKPPEPQPKMVEQPQPQPTPTPPPPTPQAAPSANDALTAREGAAAGNFGLAAGNGSGTRIGGAPGGGDVFGAYAGLMLAEVRHAIQGDPVLSRGRYTARIAIQVAPDGHILSVRVVTGSGDPRRDQALQTRLVGIQLSRRPPDGLPIIRGDIDTRSGA